MPELSLSDSAVLALIGLLALVSQWLAWRTRVPSIVYLLAAGIAAGPVFGVLDAQALLGDLLFPVVSLAVAVILFEGSLTLRFHELRNTGSVLWRLLSLGVLVTWGLLTLAAHWLLDLALPLAILFGAIMVVTGPTVIAPMLRAVRPTQNVARLLRWEGVVIDPVGAVLAIVVFDVILSQAEGNLLLQSALATGEILVIGGIGGCAGGYLLGLVLRNYWLPEYLHNIGVLLTVLIVFVVTDSMAHESGLLAVTAMGIWLANMPGVHTEDILDFKESLTVLLISALFILLASRLDLGALGTIAWPALALFLFAQFVVRPLNILVSTVPSELSWGERGLLAWIAPRGIVAAAISALFALKLEEMAYPGAEIIVPLAFAMIIGTVLWQGLTAPVVARLLGVSDPEPRGMLFVGANPVVFALAKRLKEAGFPVLVADSSWNAIREARMADLPTFFGNPVSQHAERHLELTGIGKMMAMSPREELNALACLRFGRELGRNSVFALSSRRVDRSQDKRAPAWEMPRQELFGEDVSLTQLSSLLAQGASIRQTTLTDSYPFAQLRAESPEAIMLLGWNSSGELQPVVESSPPSFGSGWTLLSLVPAPAERAGDAAAGDLQAQESG
jgi:NhaP-type Na+/H+ or K+/H+ antiporter